MIAPDDLPILADEVPAPRRFWWLKRIAITSALLLVALTGLRLWWGHEAHRRLQAEIDRIIAAGEPIYPEDFDSKNTVPDDENAVTALEEAIAALVPNPTDEELALVEKTLENPPRIVQPEALEAFLEQERGALDKLRESCRRAALDWKVQFRWPSWMTVPGFANLSLIRSLTKVALADAAYMNSIGNDGQAMERFDDLRQLCDMTCAYPTLIYQLVGWAIDSLALSSFEDILPNIAISDDSSQRQNDARPASRARVEALISALSDDALVRHNFCSAFRVERSFQIDMVRQIRSGTLSLSSLFSTFGPSALPVLASDWPLLPLYESDTVETLRWFERALDITQRGQWKEVGPLGVKVDSLQAPAQSIIHPFSKIITPSLQASFRHFFRVRAMRQMAATALAIRLYQLDHDGQRPKELAELVPDYLPNVPLDPFADGKPIGYRPDAEPPYLYTVNEDGIDQGGEYRLGQNGSVDHNTPDCPFFLANNAEQERLLHESDERKSKERGALPDQARENDPDKKAGGGQRDKDQQAR